MAQIRNRLAILGSTGSIGRQTLDVVRALPDRFQVVGLAAGSNIALLEAQADEFKPELVAYSGRKVLPGYQTVSLEEMAAHPSVDKLVIATGGRAGLRPLLAAIRAGKVIALSNKEALVMAGAIMTREARLHKATILPVDSEHSAIWQCLHGETSKPDKIILTASGGPFRHFSAGDLEKVTVEQALRHPSWKMGKKVTIDSATLMNKGLEVIEARWLFDIPIERIEVVVQEQSIVHSMVEFADGAIKAQLSLPDMRLPIQYALTYPERLPNPALPRLDWSKTGRLTFGLPDPARFPCLGLAVEAGRAGGTCPAVLCGADEVAVEMFLGGRIGFMAIPRLVGRVLAAHRPVREPSLEDIEAAHDWAREETARVEGVRS